MAQLRPYTSLLESLGAQLLVITFERPETAAQYAREEDLPWPILIDQELTLYRAYGMQQAGWGRLLSPRIWWTYIRLMLRGRLPHRPTGDVHQLGGDVIVDPDGRVRYHYLSRDPADRPAVEDLFAVLRSGQPSDG